MNGVFPASPAFDFSENVWYSRAVFQEAASVGVQNVASPV